MGNREGFDAPANIDSDLLNRAPFAHEVFRMATTSPSEWSVRIGIYGKWGTGKTTVLKLVEHLANSEGHITCSFNPWQHTDQDEMWYAFANIVRASLDQAGVTIPGASETRRYKSALASMTSTLKALAEATPVSKALTAAGMPFLTRWIRASQGDFEAIKDALGEKRLIVMVDDLDRTDPRLVPQILYALREILDLPGVSFILAFDPVRVGSALREHHSGWGDGREFLEKIIDFPRYLPQPSDLDSLSLIQNDVSKYCNFIDVGAIREIFDLLPRNPRQMRQFVRHLWALERVVKRHDPDEIDWLPLILAHLLKTRWPELTYALLDDPTINEDFFIRRARRTRPHSTRPDGSLDDGEQHRERHILALCERYGIAGDEVRRVLEVVQALGDRCGRIAASQVRNLAFLGERPPVITGKEFKEIISAWEAEEHPEEFGKLMKLRAAAWTCSIRDLASALFERLLTWIDEEHSRIFHSRTEEQVFGHVFHLDAAWRLLRFICLDMDDGLTAKEPSLEAIQFRRLLGLVRKWSNWMKNSRYESFKAEERNLVSELARRASSDPVVLLRALLDGDEDTEETSLVKYPYFDKMQLEIRRILEARIAEGILDLLDSPFQIEPQTSAEQFPGLHLLFDRDGPLWSSDKRLQFLRIGRPMPSRDLGRNMLQFLEVLVSICETCDENGRTDDVSKIFRVAEDHEVIAHAWWLATCRPWNPIWANHLSLLRADLEPICKFSLPVPDWWSFESETAHESGM